MALKLHLLILLTGFALASGAIIQDSILQGHTPGESYHLILSPDTTAILNEIKSASFSNRNALRASLNAALKNLALKSQKNILPILEKHAQKTSAKTHPFTYQPLWIVNQIVLTNPTQELLKELALNDNVVDVVKEIIFTIPENDLSNVTTQATGYWELDAFGAEDAWTISEGAGVTIAILDTGINNGHEQFNNPSRIVAQYNAISGSNSAEDDQGHGTHCAGIAAGSSSGFARKANLIAVKVLNSQGSGTSGDILEGLEYLAEVNPAPHVLSMSLGATSSLPGLEDALNVLHAADVAVVAAAGNTGCGGGASYPASYENVWSIGAVKSSLQWDNSYSWCGIFGAKPDACAGGTAVTSAWLGGSNAYNTISGTSMACPGAAGVAALVRSVNSGLSNNQVKELILANTIAPATGGTCGAFGGPACCNGKIIHAGQAVSSA